MKLLIIRPQPGAGATAARVTAAGHEPLLMPLFAVAPVAWNMSEAAHYDGLLLTSANAVREAGPQLESLTHLPVLAVGKVTASAAAQAGLQVSVLGNAGVESLLRDVSGKNLLWLAGEDHIDVEAPASVHVETHIVYRSIALPVPASFSGAVLKADHVLLHSARAARHFASLVSENGLQKAAVSIATLSENIARAAGTGWKSVHVAYEPSDAALLSLL